MAGYNKFNNNCHRDAILVGILNCLTSIFAGFVVFATLGVMAYEQQKEVTDVATEGAGLAFVVYPAAIREVDFGVSPTVIAIMFFGMIISLGIDSMLAMHETITTAILDHFPSLWHHLKWVVVSTCTAGFFAGLVYCTRGGEPLLTLVDLGKKYVLIKLKIKN